jgi:hypothetical protein
LVSLSMQRIWDDGICSPFVSSSQCSFGYRKNKEGRHHWALRGSLGGIARLQCTLCFVHHKGLDLEFSAQVSEHQEIAQHVKDRQYDFSANGIVLAGRKFFFLRSDPQDPLNPIMGRKGVRPIPFLPKWLCYTDRSADSWMHPRHDKAGGHSQRIRGTRGLGGCPTDSRHPGWPSYESRLLVKLRRSIVPARR